MAIEVSQEVIEVVSKPTTTTIEVSQEVVEVVRTGASILLGRGSHARYC